MLKSKLGWEGDSSSASKIRRKHFQAVNVVVLLVHFKVSLESLHGAVEDYLFHQSPLLVDSRSGYSDTLWE